ncbi:hypothetical protein D3C87_2207340 [compost metagenome]
MDDTRHDAATEAAELIFVGEVADRQPADQAAGAGDENLWFGSHSNASPCIDRTDMPLA